VPPADGDLDPNPQGVVVSRTGGHTPGHSVVRLASSGERLTFLGDAVFPDHFDRPGWCNAFDHYPEEAVRVRRQDPPSADATANPLLARTLYVSATLALTAFTLTGQPGAALSSQLARATRNCGGNAR